MNSGVDVDQVEIEAIKSGIANLSVGLNDEIISGEIDEEIEKEEASGLDEEINWASKDIVHDNVTSKMSNEIKRRNEVMGDLYPFELRNDSLVFKDDKFSWVYKFCLLLFNYPNKQSGYFSNKLSPLFEELCLIVSKNFFSCSEGVRTGWPNDNKLQDSFTFINEKTNELEWDPDLEIITNKIKDHGIDFVSWKMIDDRKGVFFTMGQCAGGNNFSDKLADLSLRRVKEVVKMPYVDPVLSFWTPWLHIEDKNTLHTVSNRAGLFFDRARILLSSANSENFEDLKKEINSASKSMLSSL